LKFILGAKSIPVEYRDASLRSMNLIELKTFESKRFFFALQFYSTRTELRLVSLYSNTTAVNYQINLQKTKGVSSL